MRIIPKEFIKIQKVVVQLYMIIHTYAMTHNVDHWIVD